jgi:hypothetical protein
MEHNLIENWLPYDRRSFSWRTIEATQHKKTAKQHFSFRRTKIRFKWCPKISK